MVKNVVSLEQGGESKANFVNHGPHDVSGPASMSSLRETWSEAIGMLDVGVI